MMKRILCLCVVACLTPLLGVKAEVKVENGVYQDVLLSFAPNVENANAQELVNSLKELLEHTSQTLYAANGLRFGTVTVRLPSTWNTSTLEGIRLASSEQIEQKPDILVDATENSALGKKPIALQYGGCTVSGHQITLPLEFVSSSDDYPKGKLLAREWLKYRYGVFDENGFEGDDMYPEYYIVPGSSDITITECTSPEVRFYFKNPKTGDNCSMDTPDELGNCKVYPEEEDVNVTSSLMYYHEELKNMEHICGGQDHTHKHYTQSKHNTLCKGESIWDVLKKSSDFSVDGPFEKYQPVELFLIQDNSPRVALYLENSDGLYKVKTLIEFGVMRLLNDLPSQSKIGVSYFTKDVTESRPFSDLSNRDLVSGFGDFGYSEPDICTSCALTKAVDELLKDTPEGAQGTIILITHSKFNGDISGLKEIVGSSQLCLNLIRFVKEDSDPENYDQLKDVFSCIFHREIEINDKDGENFEHFYNYMNTHIPKPVYDYQVEVVTSWSMSSERPLIIPMDPIANYFTLWLFGSVDSGSIQCKSNDNIVTLEQKIRKPTISSYIFEAIKDDANNVSCVQRSSNKPPLLTQVQKTSVKGHYFVFDVWYHDTTPSEGETQMPVIIYVNINYGGYPVVEANIIGIVTAPNEEKTEIQFFDNGKGDPDITKHDGLYSGYFTNFVDAGNYSLNVIVSYKESETMTGKKGADICCGSQVKSEMFDAPSFRLEKNIDIKSISKKPDDGYPPTRILDLKVIKFDPPTAITLGWTAPGGGEASSYEFYLFCESEVCNKNGTLPRWLIFNSTQPKPKFHGEQEVELLFVPELPKADNLHLFFVIISVAGYNQLSDASNRAEMILTLSIPITTTNNPITTDYTNNDNSATIGAIVGGIIVGVLLLSCISVLFYFFIYKPRKASPKDNEVKNPIPVRPKNGTEISDSFRATNFRDRGSMRRVESFPVLLYTHDQIKDFKKKVDPPLYRPAIVAKPWMSMNVLSNCESNKDGDCKSLGSSSTVPVADKNKSSEIEQLDDISHTSKAS